MGGLSIVHTFQVNGTVKVILLKQGAMICDEMQCVKLDWKQMVRVAALLQALAMRDITKGTYEPSEIARMLNQIPEKSDLSNEDF